MAKWRVNEGKVSHVAGALGAALAAIAVNGVVNDAAAHWLAALAAGLAAFAGGLHVTQNNERPEGD